jgi:cytochrome c2
MVRAVEKLAFCAFTALVIGCSAPPTPTPTSTPIPPTATLAPTSTPVPPSPTATRLPVTATPAASPATIGILKGDAAAGEKLFHNKKADCTACHDETQNFPGGDYAPNLGDVAMQAEKIIKSPEYTGKAKTVADYFRESIMDPNAYIVPGDDYRDPKDGLSGMRRDFAQRLSPQDIEDLVAYLLTLKGAAPVAGAQPTAAPATSASLKGDAENGKKLFGVKKTDCLTCHDDTVPFPGGDFGPNLGNVTTNAAQIIKSQEYKGKAKTVEEYLRESIVDPNAYIVPGDDYRDPNDGLSGMKRDYATKLTPQEIEDLVAYLLTLK